MGYLSDTAVYNHLMDCTFLAAFFEKGLRANNTIGQRGHGVRLRGDHQPRRALAGRLVHLTNVIDINRCERCPTLTRRSASAGPPARSRTAATAGIAW